MRAKGGACGLRWARPAGKVGGREAEAFAKALLQEDLRALGARCDSVGKRYVAPSDTTFQRVLATVDASDLERVAQRWMQPRSGSLRALAGDGKRIRGANRLSPAGAHYATITLAEHGSGRPVASRSYREEGGEPAALPALLEEVDVRGAALTLDAGHARLHSAEAIVEQHGAESLLTTKGNCPQTYRTLAGLDWAAGAERRASEPWQPGHGRWEQRTIEVFTPLKGLLPFRHARQAFRVIHRRRKTRRGPLSVEILYGIPSLPAEQATAHELPALHRGHWTVENRNHLPRDVTFGEDASRIRTAHGPANNALLNNLALAIVLRCGFDAVPEGLTYFGVRRAEALQAILTAT